MTSFQYGSSLYPTEHARDIAAAADWLTAGGANPVDSLPTTLDEARTAAEEYRADMATMQWDDSNLGFASRPVDDLAALFLEASERVRSERDA